LRVADALVEVGEGLAVVEVGSVNNVSGSSQLVGEREESAGLTLCVVEEQYLGHDVVTLSATPGETASLCASARERPSSAGARA
jgi:hypothetical protein